MDFYRLPATFTNYQLTQTTDFHQLLTTKSYRTLLTTIYWLLEYLLPPTQYSLHTTGLQPGGGGQAKEETWSQDILCPLSDGWSSVGGPTVTTLSLTLALAHTGQWPHQEPLLLFPKEIPCPCHQPFINSPLAQLPSASSIAPDTGVRRQIKSAYIS